MGHQGKPPDNSGGAVHPISGIVRFLRPITSTSIPQSLVFLDCTSQSSPHPKKSGELHFLRVGTAIHTRRDQGRWQRRSEIQFSDPIEFWAWLGSKTTPRRPTWVFSHAMGADSTFVGLWERLDEGALILNRPCESCGQYKSDGCESHSPFQGMAIITDPPVIVRVLSAHGTLTFVDTNNYWRTNLAKLGHGVGHEQLSRPCGNSGSDMWSAYSRRNAEIVEKVVCGAMDTWDFEQCGRWGYTAAQLAWSSYRKTIKEKTILINHGEPHTALARKASYGGQCEAYYIGEWIGKITVLDVRSLYPYVMAMRKFPVEFLKMGKDLRPKIVLQSLENYAAIAKVIIKTSGEGYPMHTTELDSHLQRKVTERIDGNINWHEPRLVFPTGEYITYLAGPELAHAIRNGAVKRILEISWYRQASIFPEFVNYWFAKRPAEKTADNYTQDLIIKTILNSLSGYFNKKANRWKSRPELRADHRWGNWQSSNYQTKKITKYRSIAGQVSELISEGESKDSAPEIYAYITSYGRLHMRSLREMCPPRSVIYQDTDSLMCLPSAVDSISQRGLLGVDGLGYLRQIGCYSQVTIHSVKDYEVDDKIVASGVKPDATKIAPGKFRQSVAESLTSILSGTPDGTMRLSDAILSLGRSRFARRPGPDGWTVAPHFQGEGEMQE